MQEAELEDFLFGPRRISLAPIAAGLRELAAGQCFYCHKPVQGGATIDHFLLWARHIDNGIENLIFAHGKCNRDKGAYLAAPHHLGRWIARMTKQSSATALRELASQKRWDSHADATLAVARSIYLRLPAGYQVWNHEARFVPADHKRLSEALGVTRAHA
jgi:hypothetical protein